MDYSEIIQKMHPCMKEYGIIVTQGLNQRSSHLPQTKEDLVVGGLMARIATLSVYSMLNPMSWNNYIGTPPLRTQVECYFTLAWILKNINENSRRYMGDSIRRNKHNNTEREKYLSKRESEAKLKNDVKFPEYKKEIEDAISKQKDWRQSQMAEWGITDREKGGNLPRIIDMAKDANLSFDYDDIYAGLSGFSHNSWYCVYYFNTNLPDGMVPQLPIMGNDGMRILLMELSAKCLTRAYQVIDGYYDLKIDVKLPEKYWEEKESEIEEILDAAGL